MLFVRKLSEWVCPVQTIKQKSRIILSCQLDANNLQIKKVIKYEGCPHSCKRRIFVGLETTSKHIIFPHISFFIQGNTILKLYYCPSEDNMKIILFFHMSCKTRDESFALKSNSFRGWATECLISHVSRIWPPMSCKGSIPISQAFSFLNI